MTDTIGDESTRGAIVQTYTLGSVGMWEVLLYFYLV